MEEASGRKESGAAGGAGRKHTGRGVITPALFERSKTIIFPDSKTVEKVRKKYPPGTRIRLLKMEDPQSPPIGTEGVVTGVDDAADIQVSWSTGSHLAVVYGEDEVEIVEP